VVCLRDICINTLHKGDGIDDDNDNDDDDNNNNNCIILKIILNTIPTRSVIGFPSAPANK
jgi:hypothetical protein